MKSWVERWIAAPLLPGVMILAPLGGCGWLFSEPAGSGSQAPVVRSLFAHPWTWTDERGKTVRFSTWRGQPLVITTVFTSCRETCPRTIQRLREIHASIDRDGPAPQFVLVTLDPKNDTPERLLRFKQAEKLPESWHLLVGTGSATLELTRFLDLHVIDPDAHIMHDARIVVFDARGMVSRSFGGWGLEEEDPLL